MHPWARAARLPTGAGTVAARQTADVGGVRGPEPDWHQIKPNQQEKELPYAAYSTVLEGILKFLQSCMHLCMLEN